MSFTRFMASATGRGIRVAAGLAMIVAGLAMGGAGGYVLAIVGVLPLVAGAANFCVLGPLFKAPLSGKEVLASQH